MEALFDSRGVLCSISEWRHFLIAGVFSAIYPSGGSAIYPSFLIAGVFSAIYPSGGTLLIAGVFSAHISEWRHFVDSRGVLCYISE